MTQDKLNGFWPTPFEAVLPLIPHLKNVSNFIEPCAGAGDLICHLVKLGMICEGASDINPQGPNIWKVDCCEFISRFEEFEGFDISNIDYIITNPPFSRHHKKLLIKMINEFAALKPTWLLLPADFKYNDYAKNLMDFCPICQAIGRIKWIANSAETSTKNFDWYLFDKSKIGVKTQFFTNLKVAA